MNGLLALAILGLALPGWIESSLARSVMFHFLAICQLFYVYPSRRLRVAPLPNRPLHAAVVLGVALQLLVGILPAPASMLGLTPLTPTLWGLVFAASAASAAVASFTRQPGGPL